MSRALWYLRIACIVWHKTKADWVNDPTWDTPMGDAWVQLHPFIGYKS
jgi:hypothetical protein